ncbi:MAG: tRNA pseudouridine(55) synthase TruB [Chitinophagia bacterium]
MRQKPIPAVLSSYLDGKVLLIDKPLQWTSFDIVNKIRYMIRVKKVGHAGTLDPLATGLLIVCTGKFTKQINEYQGLDKEYIGTLVLGATTASYDLETEPENFKSIDHLTEDQIMSATYPFVGEILQMPPQHSAIKKEGVRLYESARKGIEVKVDPRKVNIQSFEITRVNLPHIEFKVVCSTGTYIRSLVKDFGEALGVGAYMSHLRRTKIGDFKIEDAIQWEDLKMEIDTLLANDDSNEMYLI